MVNNTIAFIEILDKLPFRRRREVFNFLEFIYQKTMEEDIGLLSTEELKALKESRKNYLKKSATNLTLEEAKRKLKIKYGL